MDEHHNAAYVVVDSVQKCNAHHIGVLFLKAQAACAGCLIASGSRSSNFSQADHTSLLCLEQKRGWKSAGGCFIFRQLTQALSCCPSLCSQRLWLEADCQSHYVFLCATTEQNWLRTNSAMAPTNYLQDPHTPLPG